MRMMWGCVAILAVALVLSAAGAKLCYLLVALPCMAMMAAMMWMMMGGIRGGSRGRGKR